MPPKKKACNGQLLKDLLDDSEHLKAVKEEFGRCVVLQRRHTGELAKALENVVAFEREKYIKKKQQKVTAWLCTKCGWNGEDKSHWRPLFHRMGSMTLEAWQFSGPLRPRRTED